jgi:hypothetical protein
MSKIDKIIEFLFKILFITGFCMIIYWIVHTISTWTSCLVSISESLKTIAEKL